MLETSDPEFDRLTLGLLWLMPACVVGLFLFSIKQTEATGCPIVVDLNGNDRIDITGHTTSQNKLYTLFTIGKYVNFDILADGKLRPIDWVQPNKDGILVDISGWKPGESFTGLHLFGTVGRGNSGENATFENGFEKLLNWDLDGNGTIEGEETADLRLWIDNGDAWPDPEELKTFAEAGLSSLSTVFSTKPGPYGADVLVSHATGLDGSELYVEDIWFMRPDDADDRHLPFGYVFHADARAFEAFRVMFERRVGGLL